jgi:hypothetical protein
MRNGSDRCEGVKRMWQIIFNGLTVVSLVLCVVTLVLWVFGAFDVTIVLLRHPFELYSGSDRIWYAIMPRNFSKLLIGPIRIVGRGFLVGGFARYSFENGETGLLVGVKHWFVVACTAALGFPAARQVARWIHRRQLSRHGCCHVCGYDLRATPDRCPECGTAISAIMQ